MLRLFMLLKLDEEKFFLNRVADGDPVCCAGTDSSPSACPSWPKGDGVGLVADTSVGLASNKGGDEGL